jgi:hypothetical protein
VGVEPTGDGGTRRPPVLKTGTITGPHALPQRYQQKATDHQTAADQNDFFSDPRESVDPWPHFLTCALPPTTWVELRLSDTA